MPSVLMERLAVVVCSAHSEAALRDRPAQSRPKEMPGKVTPIRGLVS